MPTDQSGLLGLLSIVLIIAVLYGIWIAITSHFLVFLFTLIVVSIGGFMAYAESGGRH